MMNKTTKSKYLNQDISGVRNEETNLTTTLKPHRSSYISMPISARSIKQRAMHKLSVDRLKGNTNPEFK